ncbi:MAG: hypothetical protein M1830_005687 [Pleopsidium flavum]|nr:MAG: hypothetical protein M1830_005687 [Pleopsidium flavum]
MISTYLPSILLLSASVLSQTPTLLNFAPGALPACANLCTPLYNAQNACIPPAAPATNQQTYQGCFCQSGYLTSLYNTPTGICDQACGSADLTQIQNWYKGLCGQRAGVAPGSSTVAGSTTLATSTSTSATGVAGAHSSSTPSSVLSQSNGADSPQHDWFGTHWRWVVMLIILFLGLALIAVASVLLRRRYRRRKESQASMMNTSASVEAWYPQQRSVHDFGAGGYGMAGPHDMQREKGKGAVGLSVDEQKEQESKENRGRLKKGWLRTGR